MNRVAARHSAVSRGDGLVSRTVHAVVPPRVDYALTPMGKTLLATVTDLAR
jgi:DNA-binding HxlR family transcriptional regulator